MNVFNALKGAVAMVTLEGRLFDRAHPAKFAIAGVPIFERDENGKQRLLHVFRMRDARK